MDRIFFMLSIGLVALGLFLQLWPLGAAGILLLAFTDHPALSIMFGILLDLLYGPPLGHAQFLVLPFTVAALLGTCAYRFGMRIFFPSASDTLR